jgi:hypothetical protein
MILFVAGCLADLKPEHLESAEQGRALMEAAAEAHGGLQLWEEKQTTELLFRDVWLGVSRLLNPWPHSDIRARIVQRPRTFDSVATFLHPEDRGLVWGIEGGQAWQAGPDGVRHETDDANIHFMLPTVQYFVEMPFRFLEAEIIRSAGTQTLDGVDYEVVYLTWRTEEANREFDQYLVYLDPQTGRLAKVAYTVREAMAAAQAVAHFDELREVDGIWLPHRMRVTHPGDGAEDWFHEMSLEEVHFDTYARETLQPLSTR